MRIPFKPPFRPDRLDNHGYALLMIMVFLAATILVLGSVMLWTESNAKQISRHNLYFSSQAAAEAATEQVVAQMSRDYLKTSLNPASNYETNYPAQTDWPVTYNFSSSFGSNTTYVNIPAASTNLQPLGSQWAGLLGFPTTCTISSTATPINQRYAVPATVTEKVQYADIPLFQYAIFFNMNLEIQPGAAMNIGGPVFCNDSIWAASTGLTFSNSVTAAGTINSNNIADPFMTGKTGSGNPAFMGGIATNHAELNLPVGTNNNPASVEAILKFPPSAYALGTAGAYTTNGQVYLANQADLIITNTSSGGSSTLVYWQDPLQTPAISSVPMDYYIISNQTSHAVYPTNTIASIASPLTTNFTKYYAGYSFLTNGSFYDYRESKTVQAIYLNVTNLNTWSTNTAQNGGASDNTTTFNDSGKGIDAVYIYNSVPMSSSTLPAVRIINGAQLPPYGLAVATPDPIYVQGNYNVQTNNLHSDAGLNATTYTYPAALFGDALTILSTNWNDATYINGYALTSRNPAATTVNAATLEGIVPSSGSNYSGGVENFLRLLENWSNGGGVTLTYNGSIVVMFPSQYATNKWITTGTYYNAPTRHWAFDINFTQQGGLPPMTPRVKGIIRQGWTP